MAIKIFIDQGHNPQNPNAGAEGNGLREQDITYDTGLRLASLLRDNGNFEVRLSRNTPTEQLVEPRRAGQSRERLGRRLLHKPSHKRVERPVRERHRSIRVLIELSGLRSRREHRRRHLAHNGAPRPRHLRAPVALCIAADENAVDAHRDGLHNKPGGRQTYERGPERVRDRNLQRYT